MRWPPWLLILVIGLLAALAWLVLAPSAEKLDGLEETSNPIQEADGLFDVLPSEELIGLREASESDSEAALGSSNRAAFLRFLVRDAETDQPVVGARISHSHGLSPQQERSLTDADGRCAFDRENIASEHGWNFLVYAEGYQIKVHFLPGPLLPQDEVVVDVNRAGSLSGVVRKPDGSPAPLGTCVIAWIGATPSPQEFAAYRLGFLRNSPIESSETAVVGDSTRITRTDARGAFRFTDLAATQDYRLLAASEGMLSRTLKSASPETSEQIKLRLLYAWGIHLIARDAQGAPLPGNGQVAFDRGFASWSFPDGRYPIPGGTDAALPLAGLPLEYSENFIGPVSTHRFTMTEYSETEVAPSIAMSMQPPGFALHQAEYALLPLNSKFEASELKFDQTATLFGSLELEIKNSPLTEANRGERLQSVIFAKLYPLGFPESGRDEVLNFALTHPGNENQQFSGIPAGEYWLGFESFHRLLKVHWETQRLVIGSTPAKAQLDLGAVGALNLDVLTQEGSEFPGRRAWVRVKSLTENPRVSGQLMLNAGKNQISLIPTGDYELVLDRGRARTHTLVPDVPVHFRITAGETSLAEILIAERD